MRPSPVSFLSSSLFLTIATAAFDAGSDSNVVVYWGQGANQPRLAEVCSDSSIDIVALAFVNVFPDQGAGGLPGDNFGNACSFATYTVNGQPTDLLSDCPTIGPDIKTCQAGGKKILLSIGGAVPGDGHLASDASAAAFGDFMWGAFGPVTPSWTASKQPRPFGDAVVDGFDFDIESGGTAVEEYFGWATMINHLKNDLYPLDSSKEYYISGAPQCVLPDAHLTDAITNSWFDFIFVQFYNTPQCSARAGITVLDSGVQTNGYDISLAQWFAAPSFNPNSKIYIGLPAATTSAGNSDYYLTPSEFGQLVAAYRPSHSQRFGGVMLWDATTSINNAIDGKPYADALKQVLTSSNPNQGLEPVPATFTPPLPGIPTLSVSTVVTSSTSSATTSTGSSTTKSSTPSASSSATTSTTASATSSKASVTSISPTPSTVSASTLVTSTIPASTSTALWGMPTPTPTGFPPCQSPYQPCTNPGFVLCFGTEHWGLCDINYCALPRDVSLGTTCQNGAITKRDISPQAAAQPALAARKLSEAEEELRTYSTRSAAADVAELVSIWKLEELAVERRASHSGSIPKRWSDALSTPDETHYRAERSYDPRQYKRHYRRANPS